MRKRWKTIGGERFWFDPEPPAIFVRFCREHVRHVEGEGIAGTPFILEEWQIEEIVKPLLGWKRADGHRRFREAYISMARKNGKTALTAALALFLLGFDNEPGAQICCGAADRDQAKILFNFAAAQVEANTSLGEFFRAGAKVIICDQLGATVKVFSSDGRGAHGYNPHIAICDELHAHKNSSLYEAFRSGQVARANPLLVSITTAGVMDKNHICWQRYQYSKEVIADPSYDPHFLAAVWETPVEADWREEANWHAANPGLAKGASVKLANLRTEFRTAMQTPAYENVFRQLHLNQWTSQAVRWIAMHTWDANRAARPTSALGEKPRVVLGIDLAATTDLACVAAVHPLPMIEEPTIDTDNPKEETEKSSRWRAWLETHFFTPAEDLASRANRDNAAYEEWANRGQLQLCPGAIIDDEIVERVIREYDRTCEVVAVCFDQRYAADLARRLEGDGFPVIMVSQTSYKIAPAAKLFESMIVSGRLLHGGQPVMTSCVEKTNVRILDDGSPVPVKSKSRGRIDGVSATITALAHLMLDPLAGKAKSIYETRGVTVL